MARQRPAPPVPEPPEDPAYLTTQVITAIGNKRALLPFIGQGLAQVQRRLGRRRLRLLDLFAGTGIVARYLKPYAELLLVNDLEPYSQVANRCYLTNRSTLDFPALAELHRHLLARLAQEWAPGFLTELYAPRDDAAIAPGERVFYTRRNAIYLDTARRALAAVPAPCHDLLLGPLLAEASIHANTAGVFKGFYKNRQGLGQFGGARRDALARIRGEIALHLPVLSRHETACTIYRHDANALLDQLPEVDLAYLDPPYNQHPYGSNYFMLNLLVDYRRPLRLSRVSGIPADWQRSRYNQRQHAATALFDAVARCRAAFLLISYNSEGFIPHSDFRRQMRSYGRLRVLATNHPTFRGSRNLRQRPTHVTEYLYLLERH